MNRRFPLLVAVAALATACASGPGPAPGAPAEPDHAVAPDSPHDGHAAEPAPATPEQQRAVDAMLAVARDATGRYVDVRLAHADGFRQITGVLPGSAAHLISQRHLDDGVLDPARPELLLYDGAGPDHLRLVGIAFQIPVDASGQAPAAFSPPARWHRHDFHRSCLSLRVEGHPRTFRVPDAQCRARGDVVITPEFWMLHVWLYHPGPQGVFAEHNSLIG